MNKNKWFRISKCPNSGSLQFLEYEEFRHRGKGMKLTDPPGIWCVELVMGVDYLLVLFPSGNEPLHSLSSALRTKLWFGLIQ